MRFHSRFHQPRLPSAHGVFLRRAGVRYVEMPSIQGGVIGYSE